MTSRPVSECGQRSRAQCRRARADRTVEQQVQNQIQQEEDAATVQTHRRSGTIGRPNSSPRVSHGTMPVSRAPSDAVPIDDVIRRG